MDSENKKEKKEETAQEKLAKAYDNFLTASANAELKGDDSKRMRSDSCF